MTFVTIANPVGPFMSIIKIMGTVDGSGGLCNNRLKLNGGFLANPTAFEFLAQVGGDH